MKNQFDKILRDKLQDAEVTPSAEVWDNITTNLDSSKKKGFLLLPMLTPAFKYGIAASLAFLLGGLSVYFALPKEGGETIATVEVENVNNIGVKEEQKNTLVEVKSAIANITNAKGSTKSTNKVNTISPWNANPTNMASGIKGNYEGNNVFAANSNTSDYMVIDEASSSIKIDLAAKYGANANDLNTNSYLLSIESEEEVLEEVIETVEDESANFTRLLPKDNKVGYNGYWIGPTIGYNGLAFNKKFINGGMVGMDMGFDFANRFGVSTGVRLLFNSYSNLSDNPFVDPIDSKVYNSFNAVNIPLAFRYKITSLGGKNNVPRSINFVNGLDYAYNYGNKHHTFGLSSAIEYDLFLQGATNFAFGVKGSVLKNFGSELSHYAPSSKFGGMIGAYASMRFIGAKR